MRAAGIALLLAACRQGGVDRSAEQPQDLPTGDSSSQAADSDLPTEQLPDSQIDDEGCEVVYTQERVVVFHLELEDASWNGLLSNYASGVKDYHPASFAYETSTGQRYEVEEAAVRLRGNPGFSWLGEKMQFVISFNEQDPDGRFLGLRKISLDASWYDPTLLRDRLAYAYMRSHGVPAPCANSAELHINGQYYGLYKNVEYMDHEFLERVFSDELATGVLWKYGTEAVANEDLVQPSAMSEFWSNYDVAWQEQHTDLEGNLREWATEVVIPHNDGYWCCAHNFYIYEHPEKGLMFLPWDLDYAFDATPYWADPYTWYRGGAASHMDAVLADAHWRTRFLQILREAVDDYEPETWEQRLTEWAPQIHDSFVADPHTNFSLTEHETSIERLGTYLHSRHAWLSSWTDCQLEQPVDQDGDGYDSCQDCDDGDPSIHPGAAEQCNQRDDDCNGFLDDDLSCDTCEEHAFGDSKLLICWNSMSWSEAQAECQAHGGQLGFPKSTEDWYVFMIYTYWHYTYWAGIYYWWLGASDQAQEGVWVDPEGASATPWASWASGQPDGGPGANCAAGYPNSYVWYDMDCEARLPFLCRLP